MAKTLDITWAEFGKMITRYEFQNRSQRKGQVVFNVFAELCPECANNISGTENDPFYHDDKLDDFMYRIAKLFKEVPEYVQREATRRGFV